MEHALETSFDMPALARAAELRPETWDAKTRSFQMVLSTGAAVLRRSWWSGESWIEELSLEPGHFRTERLDAGIAILAEHGDTPLSDPQVGVSRAWKLETLPDGKRAIVLNVQLSQRDEVKGLAQDVADGVKRYASAGYKTYRQEKTEGDPKSGRLERRVATDWEPMEGSLVAIPADAGASVRSIRGSRLYGPDGEPVRNRCVVVISSSPDVAGTDHRSQSGGATLDPTKEELEAAERKRAADAAEAKRKADADAAEAAKKSGDDAAKRAAERENGRHARIRELERTHKLDARFVDELVAKTTSEEEVRSMTLQHLGQRQAATPTAVTQVGKDPMDNERAGLQAALEVKAGLLERSKLDERSNGYADGTLLRMFERYLERSGVKIESVNADWIGRRAFGMVGTSDLPKVLENIAQKSLERGYSSIPTTWRLVASIVNATDFKDRSVVHTGLGSKLQKVLETGEIEMGKFAEGGEKYHAESWGIIQPFTFKALRNDDLGAIARVPQNLGVQAAMNVDEQLWLLITANGLMADGTAIFAAGHKNVAASGKNYDLTGSNAEKGLGELERVLRVQLDDDGNVPLGLPPAYLIVPAALAVAARKLTAIISQPTQTSGVNVFDFLKPVINPRLDAASTSAYYLATLPSIIPLFEVAFLDGRETPIIDTKEGFEQDGMLFRCRWYWGGVVPNHRAAALSTGLDA